MKMHVLIVKIKATFHHIGSGTRGVKGLKPPNISHYSAIWINNN